MATEVESEAIAPKVLDPTETIIETDPASHEEAAELPAPAATEIVANEYVQEISTTDDGTTIDATHMETVGTTTVHLVHDTQSVPQQVIETTTTELNAAAAMLSVGSNAGADQLQVIQQLDVAATPVLTVAGDAGSHVVTTAAMPASYTISSSADGRLIVSTDGGQSTEILMLNQGQGNQVQVVTATPAGADGSAPSQFTLALAPGSGASAGDTPMTPGKMSAGGDASGSVGKGASPNTVVKLERQKQQKRLLRKLQACAQEYCLRLGEECAVVASVRAASSGDDLGQREVQVFGSKSFEEILRRHTGDMKVVLDEKGNQSMGTGLDAVLPGAQGVPVLPLPPRDLESMNGNELKSYVPLLLRHCMGRSRPMWGLEEHRPVWWPPEIPFQNVRMDTRSPGPQRDKQTWSSCLRQMVRACFMYFGCDGLLQGLPKSQPTTQCNMVVFSPQGGNQSVSMNTVPVNTSSDQTDMDQSLNTSNSQSAGGADQPQEATTVPLPSAGVTVVESGAVAVDTASAETTPLASTPITRRGRRKRSAPGSEPTAASPRKKATTGKGAVKVHFKSDEDEESLAEVAVNSKLTCADVLGQVGRDEKEYELRTAYNDGAGLVGNVANLITGKEGLDVYVVKRSEIEIA